MTAADWDDRYSTDERIGVWAATPNRFLLAEAGGLPPGRALDLACGMGRNAIWLAERGWEVTGVDFSTVAIDTARTRAAGAGVSIDFALADLTRYDAGREAYDLVLVFYLQLARPALEPVLAGAARAVAPGGTLLLVGHDLLNLTDGVGGPRSADVLYTPDDVTACLAGLEVERAERVERDVSGETRAAIDCLVRARRIRPRAPS